MSFKLSPEQVRQVLDVVTMLRDVVEESRSAWDERSERWQEGDRGVEADAWIETLEEVADSLDDLEAAPG